MSEVVQIPRLLEEYRLVGEAYRGPATVAWHAEHLPSGLSARVSIVAPPAGASREATDAICRAFRRALERAGGFSAADILPFDGAAEHEGLPCAVTILPEGTVLSAAMNLSEPVAVQRVMQVGSVIGHALARLHDAGLWHGYLHPASILLVADERPALLEPLIHAAAAAAAWQAGLNVAGSSYVGVGERAFRELDPFVDVYALASILLQILTGRSPERMLIEQIQQHLPQAIPASLRQDLLAALNVGGQARPPTARALAVHLSFDVAWLRATSELGSDTRADRDASQQANGNAARVSEEPRASEPRRNPLALPAPQLPTSAAGVGDAPPQPTRYNTVRPATNDPRPLAPSPSRPLAPFQAAHSASPSRLWSPRWSVMVATAVALMGICLPAGYLIGESRFRRPEPSVAGKRQVLVHEVQIGPYPDRPSAAIVQEDPLREWPEAVIVLGDGGQVYIHVLRTAYYDKAQRAASRLRVGGYGVRIHQVARSAPQ